MENIKEYAIVLDSNGNTVKVNTKQIADSKKVEVMENGNNPHKKIKTDKNQVLSAQEEQIKDEALLSVKPVEVVEEETKEEPVVTETPAPVVPEVVVEEVNTIEPVTLVEEKVEVAEEIKEEKPVVELEPVSAPIKPKYSFEEDTPVTTETPVVNIEKPKVDPRLSYDGFYNTMVDPLEKLKKDLEKADLDTLSGKTLKIGIAKLSKYDDIISEGKLAIEDFDKQIKELEEKRDAKKLELKDIEKAKADDVKTLTGAVTQANQIDAYEKSLQEAEVKKAKEEELRRQKEEQEKLEAELKLNQMYSRIPEVFREEEPKTVVSMEEIKGYEPTLDKGIEKTSSVFNKLQELEKEVPTYDFGSIRKIS